MCSTFAIEFPLLLPIAKGIRFLLCVHLVHIFGQLPSHATLRMLLYEILLGPVISAEHLIVTHLHYKYPSDLH